MHREIGIGRIIVLATIGGIVAMTIAPVAAAFASRTAPTLFELARYGLTFLLLLYLYRGAGWAKWLTVAFLVFGGLAAGFGFIVSGADNPWGLALLSMAGATLTGASLLAFSPHVRAFFQHQRQSRAPGETSP